MKIYLSLTCRREPSKPQDISRVNRSPCRWPGARAPGAAGQDYRSRIDFIIVNIVVSLWVVDLRGPCGASPKRLPHGPFLFFPPQLFPFCSLLVGCVLLLQLALAGAGTAIAANLKPRGLRLKALQTGVEVRRRGVENLQHHAALAGEANACRGQLSLSPPGTAKVREASRFFNCNQSQIGWQSPARVSSLEDYMECGGAPISGGVSLSSVVLTAKMDARVRLRQS